MPRGALWYDIHILKRMQNVLKIIKYSSVCCYLDNGNSIIVLGKSKSKGSQEFVMR